MFYHRTRTIGMADVFVFKADVSKDLKHLRQRRSGDPGHFDGLFLLVLPFLDVCGPVPS